jgi:EAL domain-containing protein (putative c-di-GMP-specific phosphodiesterase class I)
MNERLMERLQLEAKLRGALERGGFRLHFQPKVSLDTGAISGFEALLRWQHGDGSCSRRFHPDPRGHRSHRAGGRMGGARRVRADPEWQAQGISGASVAINLSTRQFQHKNLGAYGRANPARNGCRAPTSSSWSYRSRCS